MEEIKSFASAARSSGGVIPLEKGKIPPQAVDLEEAVLGAMLIDKKGVDEVIDILQAEAFYKTSHQYIFESIFELFEASEPIDLLTVSNNLKKKEARSGWGQSLFGFIDAKSGQFGPHRISRTDHSPKAYPAEFD